MNNFKGQDPSLPGSSECDFLQGSINGFKNESQEDFEKVSAHYKQTNSGYYDAWNKSMLNKLYTKIKSISGGDNGKMSNKNSNKISNKNMEKPEDFLGENDVVENDDVVKKEIVNEEIKKNEIEEDEYL